MSSARFPGKMLAPFAGRPMVASVLDGTATAAGCATGIVLLTSMESSDDALADFVPCAIATVPVFRGDLRQCRRPFPGLCLKAYPLRLVRPHLRATAR